MTNGGAEALYIALQSILRPGDRVLIAGPSAPGVEQLVAFTGAGAVALPVQRAARFIPDPAAILDAEPAPRVVMLASPSPVTGVAIPGERLAALVDAAHARGALVILDRSLAWCGFEQGDTNDAVGEAESRILTIGSFSTAYAMSGWRVGYFSAPEDLINAMSDLKVAMSICTSAISQYAALAALEGPPDWLAARRASFAQRRDLALGLLHDAGMDALVPDAWPSLLLDTRLMHPDDREAATMIARDTGVRVEPASRYGPSLAGYTRITLAAPKPPSATASSASARSIMRVGSGDGGTWDAGRNGNRETHRRRIATSTPSPSIGRGVGGEGRAPMTDQTGAAAVNIFDLMELAKQKPNAISLGLGDPDLATPAHIVDAAKRAIDEGRTGAAPPTGLLELRQAIARKLARDNGVQVDPEHEVLVTTGGQEALFLLIQGLIEPGDEVLVPDPRYPSYDQAIELAGGKIVLVPDQRRRPRSNCSRKKSSGASPTETKVLLLISPNNPTGGHQHARRRCGGWRRSRRSAT